MKSLVLDICIPTWNSNLFLPYCIQKISETTSVPYRITILDKFSSDGTVNTAQKLGCRVIQSNCTLPDALNILLKKTSADFILFMHADTILLSPQWFPLTSRCLVANTILVSPEDIGCGPYTRQNQGANMPESSFMLFVRHKLNSLKRIRLVRRFTFPFYPQRIVDFYSQNVTHYIPRDLAKKGLAWKRMDVHISSMDESSLYESSKLSAKHYWHPQLEYLRYGLGNFYSVDGVVTHYHNWYDRIISKKIPSESDESFSIPHDYINERSSQFLSDLTGNCVVIPEKLSTPIVPSSILQGLQQENFNS